LLCQFLWWTGAGEPLQHLGVIIDKNENDLYTIATVDRVSCLISKYTRADFTLCPQQLLKDSDINRDKHVSLPVMGKILLLKYLKYFTKYPGKKVFKNTFLSKYLKYFALKYMVYFLYFKKKIQIHCRNAKFISVFTSMHHQLKAIINH